MFQAIIKAGGVSEANKDMRKVGWHRTSRTDKGVHAAMNIIGLKLILEPDIVEGIKRHLPKDIYLYGYKRVTGSFNPKNMCDSRQYEYVIPTFAFKKDTSQENPIKPEELTLEQLQSSTLDLSYRIDQESLDRANALFAKFVGTRCYRNFTAKNKIQNLAATSRYIKTFSCNKPVIIDGVEVVIVTILGQSFIYNQIRKMIGFVISIMRGYIEEEDFKTSLDQNWFYEVPTAPGNGLLLESVFFTGYNKKNASIHGPLVFDEYQEQIQRFKQQIYEGIVRLEKEKQM